MKSNLWNTTQLLEMLNQDKAEMLDLMKMFVDLCPGLLEEINIAIHEKDFVKAAKTAHKLKTSIRIWEINTLTDDVLKIENCVKLNLDCSDLKNHSDNLQSLLSIVIDEMKEEIKRHTKN